MLSVFAWGGCDTIEIVSPQGPDGQDAYKVWEQSVKEGRIKWSQGTDLANYFKYLKGEDGAIGRDAYLIWKDWIADGSVDDPHRKGQKWAPGRNTTRDFYAFLTGARGEDGLVPFVNDKGNWQIGTKDTGIQATGKDGRDGRDGADGTDGRDGRDGSDGQDGRDGTDGRNGRDGKDGANGSNGHDGTDGTDGKQADTVQIIGGYWHINGKDTGVSVAGSDGASYAGKSAYELWVIEVQERRIYDPDGHLWPSGETTLNHFYFFLDGKRADGTKEVDVFRPVSTTIRIESISTIDNWNGIPTANAVEVHIETEPGATVYYQILGEAETKNNLIVRTKTTSGDGKCTILEVISYSSVLNVWAKAEGKLRSHQMIIEAWRLMPM